jgi:hypothetical protein
MRPAKTCLSAAFLIVFYSSGLQAQDSPPYRATLKGISTVWVLIEKLPDGAKVIGLSKDTIQTDVELKLRLAGMRVVTQDEANQLPGSPCVYVNVNFTDDADAASASLELDQDVKLERTGQFVPGVETWSKEVLVTRPSGQGIRDRIKDLADQFLNAWLSVNPRK